MTPRSHWWIVAGLAVALSAAHAGDKVYRWVDKDGGVHYGDRPPMPPR